MKPTDPVAAPLLPAFLCNIASRVFWLRQALDKGEIPEEMKGKLARFTASLPFETELLSGKMEQVQRAIDGLAAQDAPSNAPLPPRADWALEAAREMEKEVIEHLGIDLAFKEQFADIILRHAPAAPDAQDGERLDDLEKLIREGRAMNRGIHFYCDPDDGIRMNMLPPTPTLRAALDQARGQKE
jgi:hypothetical protein